MDNFDNIPQEMKSKPNWVAWRYEDRGGKRTKVPYNPETGTPAKANDPSTWATHDAAAAALQQYRYDGLGFMFSGSGLVGIDVDHCVNSDGSLTPLAEELVRLASSYTEYSPSGQGLHIIGRGKVPPGGNRNSALGLEMYSEARYFTMTGKVFNGLTEIQDVQDAADQIHKEHIARPAATPAAIEAPAPQRVALSDEALLAKMMQREKFRLLWEGDTSQHNDNASSADMALCNYLARGTNRDAPRMDALFRQSGLMRPKWDELRGATTYGAMTIERACRDYSEPPRQTTAADAFGAGEGQPRQGGFPVVDAENKPIKAHWKNTDWLLCKKLALRFRFNTMTKRIDVTGGDLESLTFDALLTQSRGLCLERGLPISKADLADNIGLIAERDKYSPVVEYLRDALCIWDGQSRIEQLFNCLVLDDSAPQDRGFLLMLFRRWLISCVVMAFNDGTKAAQGVLVIKGPQGIGKTRFLDYLLPNPSWGKAGVSLDPNQKDDLLKALSYWIVELGEVRASIRQEKLDQLKAFLTDSTDALRVPYGRAVEARPRTTVFYATVNNGELLRDETGERRFWVVAIKGLCLDPALDRRQLWGEVAHLSLTANERYWLTRSEIEQLNRQNEQYKARTPEEQALLDMLDWNANADYWQLCSASEVCDRLGFPKNRVGHVGRALQRLSEHTKIVPPTTNRDRRYCIPPYVAPAMASTFPQRRWTPLAGG